MPADDDKTRDELSTDGDGSTLRAELAECRRALADLQERYDRLERDAAERTTELQIANEELDVANEELQAQTDELIAANRRLRQSEERFRAVLENSLDAAYRRDLAADRYDYISPAIETITGFSPDRFARMSIRTVMARIHPGDRKTVLSHLREWGQTGRLTLEYRFRAKDGHYVWLGDYATLVRDEEGRPRYRVGIVRDVTQRKEAEQERERLLAETQAARAEAEEANQAKDRFIAMVSHELRNPLNAIQAGVALLQKAIGEDERSVRTLEIIERNAALQARLVNDLLDLSRLQRGKLALQRVPLDVGRLVKSVCRSYQNEAEQAGLALTCKTPPELWAQGDPDRLQQVVMNILTNAVKFTPAGGRISVEVQEHRNTGEVESGEPNPESVRISVSDTGIGIDRAMLEHLFEAFRQGEVRSGRSDGLGLGLALVKGLVEQHDGRVWAESGGAGKGSRFTVELPLAAARGIPHNPGAAPEPPAGPGPIAGGRRVRLLLVEDNEDTLAMLAEGLRGRGYDVDDVASGNEALDLLVEAPDAIPDVILADIRMPGMSGYEFLQRARELPGTADVPALAVTAYAGEEDVRRATEAGFVGHFTKPVDLATLDRRIRELLNAASGDSE